MLLGNRLAHIQQAVGVTVVWLTHGKCDVLLLCSCMLFNHLLYEYHYVSDVLVIN